MTNTPSCISPLPVYWPVHGKFYGKRIDELPMPYIWWALSHIHLPRPLRGALLAESGFRVMARDQWEGR